MTRDDQQAYDDKKFAQSLHQREADSALNLDIDRKKDEMRKDQIVYYFL